MTVISAPRPRPLRPRTYAPGRDHDDILAAHRPGRRRLRVVSFAGFPLLWFVLHCRCCGRIWPCREVLATVRARLGWTANVERLTEVLAGLRKGWEWRY